MRKAGMWLKLTTDKTNVSFGEPFNFYLFSLVNADQLGRLPSCVGGGHVPPTEDSELSC